MNNIIHQQYVYLINNFRIIYFKFSYNQTLNHSYYIDSLSYSSYNTNSYPFRQQTNSHTNSSNVYFPSSTSQDITSYSNYDTTYLNVAVAAAAYQNHYSNNTILDPFDLNFSRHMNGLYGNTNEQQIETDYSNRKTSSISINSSNKKRKYQDETFSKSIKIFFIISFSLLFNRISI